MKIKQFFKTVLYIQDSEKELEKGMDEEVSQDSKAKGFITLKLIYINLILVFIDLVNC